MNLKTDTIKVSLTRLLLSCRKLFIIQAIKKNLNVSLKCVKKIRGGSMRTLLYPSAGKSDWKVALNQFIESIDKFIFADIQYTTNDINTFKKYLAKISTITHEDLIGSFEHNIHTINNEENKYQEIKPAYYQIEILINDFKKIVVFRKGFGQYALYELENDSLNCFYHRGDSQGEGGSNVFYLGDRNARHKPIAKLFDTLLTKLTNKSLIVSDGSNADFKAFNEIYSIIKDLTRNLAIGKVMDKTISIKGIDLRCINVLDYRYNHTLVWEVKK